MAKAQHRAVIPCCVSTLIWLILMSISFSRIITQIICHLPLRHRPGKTTPLASCLPSLALLGALVDDWDSVRGRERDRGRPNTIKTNGSRWRSTTTAKWAERAEDEQNGKPRRKVRLSSESARFNSPVLKWDCSGCRNFYGQLLILRVLCAKNIIVAKTEKKSLPFWCIRCLCRVCGCVFVWR